MTLDRKLGSQTWHPHRVTVTRGWSGEGSRFLVKRNKARMAKICQFWHIFTAASPFFTPAPTLNKDLDPLLVPKHEKHTSSNYLYKLGIRKLILKHSICDAKSHTCDMLKTIYWSKVQFINYCLTMERRGLAFLERWCHHYTDSFLLNQISSEKLQPASTPYAEF